MSRQEHQDGVGFAGLEVQELQNLLAAAKGKQQEVLGLVVVAVGENPVVESAQNATAFTAALGDQLDEMAGICEQIKAELNRYAGGF